MALDINGYNTDFNAFVKFAQNSLVTIHRSLSTVRILRADVVNAKDYCGKVLHEANAKKFA